MKSPEEKARLVEQFADCRSPEDLRKIGMSKHERYRMYVNHILVHFSDQLKVLTDGKTLGELMVMMAFLNAALLTQIPKEDLHEYTKLTFDFAQMYPNVLKEAGITIKPNQLALVVPAAENYDYERPPKLFDYISREEVEMEEEDLENQRKADKFWNVESNISKTIQ